MPTHNDPPPGTDLGKAPATSARKVYHGDQTALHSVGEGYEVTDVSVSGVGVFLVALAITLVIFFVFAFGMGKVINIVMRRSDGPASPWQQAGATISGGLTAKSMASSPAIEQRQLHQLTEAFPTPRLQTDDGDQDLTDLHEREDLLLTHYSYVDPAQGKVRIPIDRAMQLIAERGLPVVTQAGGTAADPGQAQARLMFGDVKPTIQVPLTNGFARTGYEQERNSAAGMAGDQSSAKANNY